LGAMRAGVFSLASLFAGGIAGSWYDPSDLSTLFQDSAGTTPVTAAGQPVGLILDKSGNNNHAVQATAAKRPTYQTSAGLHWLAFDGVDDAMATAAIDFTGTDKVSVFAGVRKLSDAVIATVASFGADVPNSWEMFSPRSQQNRYGFAHRTTTVVEVSPTVGPAPDTAVITGLSDIGAPSVSISRNGVVMQVSTNTLAAANYGNHILNIGSRRGTSLFFNGNVYGLIIPGKLASAAEITSTEAYMAAKTGVTL